MTGRWVTFDCFGTLVDWRAGFAATLEPIAGRRTPELLRAYYEVERLMEAERPHLSYRQVLRRTLEQAAAECGVTLRNGDADALSRSWGALPLFADVEPMLQRLREMGCRLAVLTNCDADLFAETQRSFSAPFDLVVTAEQVCDYKPSLSHFRYFDRRSGVGVGEWVHVACSWFHDIVPAKKVGIRSIWLDRDETGDDPATATAHVHAATDVPRIVSRW